MKTIVLTTLVYCLALAQYITLSELVPYSKTRT